MGYNTAVMFLNDAVHQLRDDPEAGRKLYDAIMESNRGQPVHVAFGNHGNHGNAAMVMPSCHADVGQVVLVGGNRIERVVNVHHTSQPLNIATELAEDHGYYLSRKPRRKVKVPK